MPLLPIPATLVRKLGPTERSRASGRTLRRESLDQLGWRADERCHRGVPTGGDGGCCFIDAHGIAFDAGDLYVAQVTGSYLRATPKGVPERCHTILKFRRMTGRFEEELR